MAVVAAFSFLALTTSCNSATENTEGMSTHAEHGTAVADSTATASEQMAYICPMECEGSASMQPGKCPVCGMDLVKNPNYTATADSTVVQ